MGKLEKMTTQDILILLLMYWDSTSPYLPAWSFSNASDFSFSPLFVLSLYLSLLLLLFAWQFLFSIQLQIPSGVPFSILCIRLLSLIYILTAQCTFYFKTYHNVNKMIACLLSCSMPTPPLDVIKDQVHACLPCFPLHSNHLQSPSL